MPTKKKSIKSKATNKATSKAKTKLKTQDKDQAKKDTKTTNKVLANTPKANLPKEDPKVASSTKPQLADTKTQTTTAVDSSKTKQAKSSKSSKKSSETLAQTKPASSQVKKKQSNILTKIIDRFAGEKKELAKYWSIVKKIELESQKIEKLEDEELKNKTQEFRDRLKGLNQKETEKKLQEILPEVFAVVREAAWRTIKQKHYPVQLIGGMVLHEGRIAEMKTGEGKTLVSTLAVYLNALPEKNQVHMVTVNDYLARRDASWMGKIYNFLGMTVGVIQNQSSFYFKLGVESGESFDKKRELNLVETYEDGVQQDSRTVIDVENLVPCSRRRAYWDDKDNKVVDIVYGVNSEFGFDYLRDNMAKSPDEVVQKFGHTVAIIDEVDSILVDEARTPLIISSQDSSASNRYRQFATLAKRLNKDMDYEVDEKRRNATLTDLGVEKVQDILKIKNLYQSQDNVVIIHHLDLCLKAKSLFKKDKEYVVNKGDIVIVDENTGRLMHGRRYSEGIHQAIEAKESLEVKPESKTVANITFQNYFRMYTKLAGMTGTAATESEEFFKIYKLIVVTIPTNKPLIREDLVDKVFKSEKGKFMAIVKDIKEANQKQQPVLVGTTSIEKNVLLSNLLKEAKVPHQLLNAKNHEQEAKIISNAGKLGSVTIATNIAGRGVDIKLGGEVPKDAQKYQEWEQENQKTKKLGGLLVIGTERHESRRIDNQLRGRSGRQGDIGKSQFYISLNDYVLRVFGSDKLPLYSSLPVPEDQPIQNRMLSKLIEGAQKKIEGYNYDVRKHVIEYDDVVNKQRKAIFKMRNDVLFAEDFRWKSKLGQSLKQEILKTVQTLGKPSKKPKLAKEFEEKLQLVSKSLKKIVALKEFDEAELKLIYQQQKYKHDKMADILLAKVVAELQNRWSIFEDKSQSAMVRYIFLRAIDLLWPEHLVTINNLQYSVRLRAYSQKDPLTEFKQEAMNLFTNLLLEIDKEINVTIFKVTPDIVPSGLLNRQSSAKK